MSNGVNPEGHKQRRAFIMTVLGGEWKMQHQRQSKRVGLAKPGDVVSEVRDSIQGEDNHRGPLDEVARNGSPSRCTGQIGTSVIRSDFFSREGVANQVHDVQRSVAIQRSGRARIWKIQCDGEGQIILEVLQETTSIASGVAKQVALHEVVQER